MATVRKHQAEILIVEDDPVDTGLMVKALEECGYRVLVAQDGEEGLMRAELVCPDLVLLDVRLPKIDGFEVCRRLKALESTQSIPIIFMTALCDMRSKIAAFKAGAADYVTKPLQVEEVIARVETQLELVAHRNHLEDLVAVRTAELAGASDALRLRKYALDMVKESAFLVDKDGMIKYVNQEACRRLGYTESELLALNLSDIDPDWPLEQRQKAWSEHWDVLREQGGMTFETHHKSRSGEIFPVEVTANYLEFDGGTYILGLVRDITERKRSERELKLLNFALDHAFDATYLIDSDMNIRYANEAASRALGYSVEELLSMNLLDIDPSTSREAIQEMMQQTLENGRFPGIIQSQHRRRDGSTFYIEIGGTSFTYEGETLFLSTVRDVSDRKEVEQRLYEQHQVLLAAVDNSPDAILRYDRELRRIYANDSMRKVFELMDVPLLGATPMDGSVILQPDKYQQLIEMVLETGEEQCGEFQFLWEDRIRWSDMRFAPEFDEVGQVASVLVVGREITERKQMEEMLCEERGLFTGGPTVVFKWQAAEGWPVEYVSPNVYEQFGYSAEALISGDVSFASMVHPDDLERVVAEVARYSDQGLTSYEQEYRIVHADGGVHWVYDFTVVTRAKDGSITNYHGYISDKTQHKLAEMALRDSEQRFRTLAENLPDNLIRYNLACQATYVNPLVARSLDIPVEELIGTEVFELLLDPDEVLVYRQALQRVMQTGKPQQIEITPPSDAGGRRIIQISFVAERRGGGEIRGALAIGRDITMLKETERRLEISNVRLKEMSRRREAAREEERKHIARELHDDLGQYLTALRLQTSVLGVEFGTANPDLAERLDNMLELVGNTQKVVRNLSQQLRPAALDMGLDAALASLVNEFVEQYELTCTLDLEAGAHEVGAAVSIVLYRTLQESLTNIARHAEADNINISLRCLDSGYILDIRDNGKGFDPSHICPTSFGLLGMRERVESVGGKLEIISNPLQGTSVIATVPKVEIGD